MKSVPLIVMLGLFAAGAWLHGSTTHRWETVELTASTQAVHDYTITFGDYESEAIPNEIPLKEKSIASCRRYTSASRSQVAVVSIITGPPGSVAVHTPDVCYTASGYQMLTTPTRETIELPGVGQASFFVADFEKTRSDGTIDRQRVRWCWHTPTGWAAPDRARFAFLGQANLTKIYIVTPIVQNAAGNRLPDAPPVKHFTATALSQYHNVLAQP